ncbi:hypothetical protein Moror_9242 [Moniliophthora roreri MCA 2997]|uniref:Retrotransposon gag domain-containing protein n=1 Tax=Moniliophthora roreri (strain MCA 2997) TaxID=1381753 RepID=V2WWL1_MONRO|nr:hypothetical protein Moror_9242 [Moniliophthora roreri MCA 2997]
MAAEETDLDKQPEVAQQLLNSDPSVTPCRITRSRQRGAIESLREFPEQEETESEAKSFETDPFDEYQTLYYTPTPEMTTPSASTVPEELAARTISMAMIETINDKKDESSKGPVPDPYEGEHSDTRHFLLDLELYFRMNPLRADTDEKKKMMRLFLEDDDPKEKRKVAKETWSSFKQRFWAEWQPINLKGQAQMKIEEIRMTDRADDYISKFRLIAMETKYDEQALMKFFREGLPISLQDKIIL